MNNRKLILPVLLSLLSLAGIAHAGMSQRISDLKANMEASKVILRGYQWVETTTVSVNGEEKSSKQQLCYYGNDGTIQRTDLSNQQFNQNNGILFHRFRERKKEELTDYMKQAVALVKSYVPPSSARIQAVKDNGNASLTPLEGGKIVRLTFTGYQLPGDTYSIDINLTTNRPIHARVSTYLGDPSQPVTLNITMGQLDAGATFARDITLNAPAKNLTVTIHNGGYRPNN